MLTYIYIYIYMYVCVCVCLQYPFENLIPLVCALTYVFLSTPFGRLIFINYHFCFSSERGSLLLLLLPLIKISVSCFL